MFPITHPNLMGKAEILREMAELFNASAGLWAFYDRNVVLSEAGLLSLALSPCTDSVFRITAAVREYAETFVDGA